MDARVLAIDEEKNRLRKMCRVFKWVFYALFAVYAVIALGVIWPVVFLPEGFTRVGPQGALSIVPIGIDVVSAGFALLLAGLILREVSRGESPLTKRFSRMFMALGLVLLVGVAAQLLIAPGTSLGVVNGEDSMLFDYMGDSGDSLNVNTRAFIEAISCFALGAVFRYASLLQKETDDLV